MRKKTRPVYLLSDLDGTIITYPDLDELMIATAASFGKELTLEEYKAMSYDDFMRFVCVPFMRFYTRYAAIDPRSTFDGAKALVSKGVTAKYEDTDDFLAGLKRLDVRLGIISDNPSCMNEVLALGLEERLAHVEHWKFNRGRSMTKPHPYLSIQLLGRMGFTDLPGDIFTLGDGSCDVALGLKIKELLESDCSKVRVMHMDRNSSPVAGADAYPASLSEALSYIESVR